MAVVIAGLRKEFAVKRQETREPVVALDGIDLSVADGELLVLVGPSGCGKTTLLRCLAGLENATEGQISINGETVFDSTRRRNVPPNKRDIGMVFQSYALWPHMSVLQNVEYPLRARGRKSALRDGRAMQALESVDCGDFAGRIPVELSGGQRQRVALARATVSDPGVLLLDEPLSNLDALLRISLREELRRFHRSIGFTGVYVTHDQSEALSLGDRVAVMRSGKIQQLAPPTEVFDRPATPHVATFIGVRNKLRVERTPDGWSTECGPLGGFVAPEATAYELFCRPEALELQPTSEIGARPGRLVIGRGRVTEALFTGGAMECHVDVRGVPLVAVVPRAHPQVSLGQEVCVTLDPSSALLYRDGLLVDEPAIMVGL